MKKEIAERWVEALRSGEYNQGEACLRNNSNFCCLGVLCDLYVKDGHGHWEGKFGEKELDLHSATLPSTVIDWAGMKDSDGYITPKYNDDTQITLWHLNDGIPREGLIVGEEKSELKLSFDEIADIIQMTWEEL